MEKNAKCKSILEFTKISDLRNFSDDELYAVAGGKNTDSDALCSEFESVYDKINATNCCENCIHVKRIKGNLFNKNHIICDIGRGKDYVSPNTIFINKKKN